VNQKYKRSSKIEALVGHLQEIIAKKEKCVVFSQFIGMLMLIEHDLKLNNIKFVVILKLLWGLLITNFLHRDWMEVWHKRKEQKSWKSLKPIQQYMSF